MKKGIEIKNLDSKVIESYSYFINNHRNTNFDALKSISLLNNINMDRLIQDSRLKDIRDEFKQYNVNSIQITKDKKVYLYNHKNLGVDLLDNGHIFDDSLSYIDFVDVKRIY
jgi:hypothetical protein